MAIPTRGMQSTQSVLVDGDDADNNSIAVVASSEEDHRHNRVVDLTIWHTGLDKVDAASTATVYIRIKGESEDDTPLYFDNTATKADPYQITDLPLPSSLEFFAKAGGSAKIKVKATYRYLGPLKSR